MTRRGLLAAALLFVLPVVAGLRPDPEAVLELRLDRALRVRAYDDRVLRPGPRIAEGLALLARSLHPAAAIP
jgi:hypothetical protein